jgi:hypothetical protein
MSETEPKNVTDNKEYFQKQLDFLGPNHRLLMLEFDPKRKFEKIQLVYISECEIDNLKNTHEYVYSYNTLPRFDRVYKKKGKK